MDIHCVRDISEPMDSDITRLEHYPTLSCTTM